MRRRVAAVFGRVRVTVNGWMVSVGSTMRNSPHRPIPGISRGSRKASKGVTPCEGADGGGWSMTGRRTVRNPVTQSKGSESGGSSD